jgi:hypothetical protein
VHDAQRPFVACSCNRNALEPGREAFHSFKSLPTTLINL